MSIDNTIHETESPEPGKWYDIDQLKELGGYNSSAIYRILKKNQGLIAVDSGKKKKKYFVTEENEQIFCKRQKKRKPNRRSLKKRLDGIIGSEQDHQQSSGNPWDRDILQMFMHDVIREADKFPILTRAEEKEIGIRIQDGDSDAVDDLVRHNIRYVVRVANEYHTTHMNLLDRINEGLPGLIKAAEKFDPHMGTKFCTYATWWINQAIKRAINDKELTVRVPVQMHETISKLKKSYARKLQEGKEPSLDDIHAEPGIEARKLKQVAGSDYLKQMIYSTPEISLNYSPGDSGNELQDFIEYKKDEDSLEFTENAEMADYIDSALKGMASGRQEYILRQRFGIYGEGRYGGTKTLDEIGKLMGLSRERVRQIEYKAKINLKKNLEQLLSPPSAQGMGTSKPMQISPGQYTANELAAQTGYKVGKVYWILKKNRGCIENDSKKKDRNYFITYDNMHVFLERQRNPRRVPGQA